MDPLVGVAAGDQSGAGEGAGSSGGTSEEAALEGQAACSEVVLEKAQAATPADPRKQR